MVSDNIVYKVVDYYGGEMHSAIIDEVGLICTYAIGEVTVPTVGYLYAFSNLYDACMFSQRMGQVRILRCEAVLVVGQKPMGCPEYWWVGSVRLWWASWLVGNRAIFNDVPNGTVWCSQIKPLEEVTCDDG